jgi:hypothetical protein
MFYSRIFSRRAVIFHGNDLINAHAVTIGRFGDMDLPAQFLMVSIQSYG